MPTVFENYVCNVEVNKRTCAELGLWDTAGQESYDRMRPLSYPDSQAIAICFAVDDPTSLENALQSVRFYLADVDVAGSHG